MTIAIDGPVGAGKSTVAAALARELGILHLDTGAMYRALALKALRCGVDPMDEVRAQELCEQTDISVALGAQGQRTLLDGEDVTGLIRTGEVSAASSAISTIAAVRAHMVRLQQACAAKADMVLDGRDIGTRVLVDATFKFYLTASPEVRAHRRMQEMLDRGEPAQYAEVLRALNERDRQDMSRAVDPLRCAEDAVVVDTSGMTLRQTVEAMLDVIKGGKSMNIIHRLTGVLIDFLYFRLFGLRFCGRENLPEHAPYILLANHRSMGDPFALGEVCRQGVVYFMAKEELFRNPIVRWYITKMHGFPVKRGKADLAAMRTALQVLKDGHVLGIFPEGTRHHDGKIGELETGSPCWRSRRMCRLCPSIWAGRTAWAESCAQPSANRWTWTICARNARTAKRSMPSKNAFRRRSTRCRLSRRTRKIFRKKDKNRRILRLYLEKNIDDIFVPILGTRRRRQRIARCHSGTCRVLLRRARGRGKGVFRGARGPVLDAGQPHSQPGSACPGWRRRASMCWRIPARLREGRLSSVPMAQRRRRSKSLNAAVSASWTPPAPM